MAQSRRIRRHSVSHPTIEGAGVHLRRAFGFGETQLFDPFLLLDDFRSDEPQQYVSGFPWHPHRGIETITLMLKGEVEHSDSLGNTGIIRGGEVQWMTAGSGIIHQEMPKGDSQGSMYGFQLWANLPAAKKMTVPKYRDVTSADIPVVELGKGLKVRLIAGELGGVRGPVDDVAIDPLCAEVYVGPGARIVLPTQVGHTVLAYVIDGAGVFGPGEGTAAMDHSLLTFEDGDTIEATAGDRGVGFLFVAGRPLKEPVAWYGPIVMNTQEELRQAFEEMERGTFIKQQG